MKNSDPLREAHAAMQPKVIAATTKLSQSRPVYEAVAALEKVGENVPSPLGTFPP